VNMTKVEIKFLQGSYSAVTQTVLGRIIIHLLQIYCSLLILSKLVDTVDEANKVVTIINKWRAVAAQTARCRSKVLSIPHVYYFREYQRQSNGITYKSFAEKSGN